MQFWENPAWITAVGGTIAGLAAIFFTRGKGGEKEEKPNLHQEVIRPETGAELKSATALESIAASMERIERHVDVFTRTK